MLYIFFVFIKNNNACDFENCFESSSNKDTFVTDFTTVFIFKPTF
jgi:hypothetical protein